MTLDQLRIFVTVAEAGHVTRAAAALGITQSAASAAVAALESRYRTRLFDRVGRGIELTETGRQFLREARAVLDRAAIARSVLEDLAGLPTGTVSIAASHTIASYWLPKRLTAFHATNPGVVLDVVIRNTREVESAVADGAAHLGLVEGPTQHPALTRLRVDTDRPVLVVAADHPPLPRNGQGRIDLRAVPWVVREEGSGTRRVLEDLAAREGLSLDELTVFLVLPGNEAIREAVEAGAGATIISEHVVASSIAVGTLRANPIDLPPRDFVVLQHRDRHASVAQQTLVKHLASTADATI
ncbi:MAG: LysR substrate-binding domain-containing protein [Xanthobacteraceae bacterium]